MLHIILYLKNANNGLSEKNLIVVHTVTEKKLLKFFR